MQHSSLVLFCDECGLANDPTATRCSACQHPLAYKPSAASTPVAPITIAPPPVREVTPGPLFAASSQAISSLPPVLRHNTSGELRPGTVLNRRYKIREEIGRGGFSIVYRATDLDAGCRDVAIKRIQLSSLTPRQIIDATETFNREITMLARLRGINGIPTFYEHLTDAENWYLITQYIEGQTLEDYLQKKSDGYFGEEETSETGIAIAQLMQELHKLDPPVIFRDLKPANLMLTPNNGFFLIDFGIARNFTPGKTRDTTPLGSPGYAPPEQYGRGQTNERSDIYSLGATLQTMLTGRDPLELRAGEPSRNPRPPSHAMRKLLDAMLSSDISRRPATMAQVERRLKARLERIQMVPQSSYLLGLIAGIIIAVIGSGFAFGGTSAGAFIWLCWPIILVVRSIWTRLKRKLGIQKVSQQFFTFGALTILLPALLLWFAHVSWSWPF